MSQNTTTTRPLSPGDEIHVVAEHGVLLFGGAYKRGDTLTVSQKQIDSQRDREGRSWADDLSDAGQLARWNEIRLGFGPWPENTARWVHGSPQWAEEREAARKRAWAVIDPAERAEARERVEEEFGKAPSTSRTLNSASSAPQRPSGNVNR